MACRSGARSTFAPEAVVHHVVLPGGVRKAVTDRWNWSTKMAGLAQLVPELRSTVFYRRLFFADWTARFDLAVSGVAASLATRRVWPLIVTAPYARQVYRDSAPYRGGPGGRISVLTRTGRYLLGAPIVDAATLAGLLAGSAAWRNLVL
jgi:hypothetical protein